MRRILALGAFIVLSLSIFVIGSCSQEATGPIVASDFTLETLDGQKVSLSGMTSSKETILVFWATWCPYCREELPAIQEFYNQNKNKIEVLGISVGESKNQVQSYLNKAGITFPMAIDSDQTVARAFNVSGIPTIIVVDKSLNIVYYGHSMVEMLERIMTNVSNMEGSQQNN